MGGPRGASGGAQGAEGALPGPELWGKGDEGVRLLRGRGRVAGPRGIHSEHPVEADCEGACQDEAHSQSRPVVRPCVRGDGYQHDQIDRHHPEEPKCLRREQGRALQVEQLVDRQELARQI